MEGDMNSPQRPIRLVNKKDIPKPIPESQASKENQIKVTPPQPNIVRLASFRLEIVGMEVYYELEKMNTNSQVKELIELVHAFLDFKYVVLRMRKCDEFIFMSPQSKINKYYKGYPEGTPPQEVKPERVLVYIDRSS